MKDNNSKYPLVATGGTFDRFHKGHAALLDKAFEVGEKVIIGVTSEDMVQKEGKVLGKYVLPYSDRISDVNRFLKEKGFWGREIISELNDVYGPTVLEGDLGAVICTRETRSGAVAINKARKKSGLRKASIVECTFISSTDGYHISSTRIRLGEINRQGEIFIDNPSSKKLPEDLRSLLSRPIDMVYPNINQVVKNIDNSVMVISVGDVVYRELSLVSVIPDIALLDLKVNRIEVGDSNITSDFTVHNEPGIISKQLLESIKKAVKRKIKDNKKSVIKVIGEEDLAVIPAILASPLNSIILYGQPALHGIENGVVRVLVTEENKKWAQELLKKFK